MRLPIVRLCAVLSVLAFAAPIHAQQGRGDRNKITRVELDEAGTSIMTAREAVRILRPQWLSPPMGRTASSNMSSPGGGRQEVVLYVDDKRQPDLEVLATISATKIVEMKYLDQNRAVLLRGPGHESGVIEITTVDKRK
ncbi:MAG: hypothetical protein ABI625_27695 [bacterium]